MRGQWKTTKPPQQPITQSRQRGAQTTSAHLHWCGADPPNSWPTHVVGHKSVFPKRGYIFDIFAGFFMYHRCVTSYMKQSHLHVKNSCHVWRSHVYIWMSLITHVNETCLHMNVLCLHVNESCLKMNESRLFRKESCLCSKVCTFSHNSPCHSRVYGGREPGGGGW